MLFFESDEVCETSYKDRGGKYQGQKGVTLPRDLSKPLGKTVGKSAKKALDSGVISLYSAQVFLPLDSASKRRSS